MDALIYQVNDMLASSFTWVVEDHTHQKGTSAKSSLFWPSTWETPALEIRGFANCTMNSESPLPFALGLFKEMLFETCFVVMLETGPIGARTNCPLAT